jgi:hypothetical protein
MRAPKPQRQILTSKRGKQYYLSKSGKRVYVRGGTKSAAPSAPPAPASSTPAKKPGVMQRMRSAVLGSRHINPGSLSTMKGAQPGLMKRMSGAAKALGAMHGIHPGAMAHAQQQMSKVKDAASKIHKAALGARHINPNALSTMKDSRKYGKVDALKEVAGEYGAKLLSATKMALGVASAMRRPIQTIKAMLAGESIGSTRTGRQIREPRGGASATNANLHGLTHEMMEQMAKAMESGQSGGGAKDPTIGKRKGLFFMSRTGKSRRYLKGDQKAAFQKFLAERQSKGAGSA